MEATTPTAGEKRDRVPVGKGTAVLVELRGLHVGSIHPLPRELFRIGGSETNDLVITDPEVAPLQLELQFLDEQFSVRNVDPTGEVFLNGEVFQESFLTKGDILTVGESVFRYIGIGDSISQRDLWSAVGGVGMTTRRGKPLINRPLFYVPMLLMLGLLICLIIWQLSRKQEEILTRRPADQAASGKERIDRNQLKALYDKGKDLSKARRWDKAVLMLEVIREAAPSFLDSDTMLQRAIEESENLEKLQQGKGLFIEQETASAKTVLEEIPEDSVYYREAEKLIRDIDLEMLQFRLSAAEKALTTENWSAAVEDAKSILAKYPGNETALEIYEIARAKVAGAVRYHGRDISRSRLPKPDAPGESGTSPASSSKAAAKVARGPRRPLTTMEKALNAYIRGNPKEALRYLDRVVKGKTRDGRETVQKAERMADDMMLAQARYKQAEHLQREGEDNAALKEWGEFLELDKAITGDRTSTSFKRASNALSTIYYSRGRQEFDQANIVGAAFFWKMAKRMNPENPDLQAAITDLEEEGEKLFKEGYALEEINMTEALKRFELAMKILPQESDYYRKAEERINALTVEP